METELSVAFKKAVAALVRTRTGDAVEEVTGWDEYVYSGGGCPTCGPDTEIEVNVFYLTPDGRRKVYTFDGKFSDLLTEILSMDGE